MIPFEVEDLRLVLESGYLYLGMRRFKEAKEVFEGASFLAPASEVPLVALGTVYFSENKFLDAIKCYQNALKLVPGSAFATAYLGESLFFAKKKDEALETLKKASEMEPNGKSGDFARALIKLIEKGFDPEKANQKK